MIMSYTKGAPAPHALTSLARTSESEATTTHVTCSSMISLHSGRNQNEHEVQFKNESDPKPTCTPYTLKRAHRAKDGPDRKASSRAPSVSRRMSFIMASVPFSIPWNVCDGCGGDDGCVEKERER